MTATDPTELSSLPRLTVSRKAASGIGAVLSDIQSGLDRTEIWKTFAWDEIKNRYRRSVLGLAWIVVSYLVLVLTISIFFGGFSSLESRRFTYHVALGFAAFSYLVGNLTDGCQLFRGAATWIKSTNLPHSIYVFKSIARSLFAFSLQILTAIAFMVCLGWRPSVHLLWVIPAVGVFLINSFWIQLVFGYVATRWPDIDHLIGATTRVMFFVSPVMWVLEEREGLVRTVASWNPFTHFIEIFRVPFFGEAASAQTWAIVGAWTVGGWAIALLAAGRMRRRLTYWV